MKSVNEILKMNEPYELFTGDLDLAKKEYLELMKKYHPDKNGRLEIYSEVSTKINELYLKCTDLLNSGKWLEPGLLSIKGVDDKGKQNTYTLKYKINRAFELGTYYIGTTSVVYLIDKKHENFIKNMEDILNNLKYADSKMETDFKPLSTKIITKFNTNDNRIGIVLYKGADVYSLRDILTYYDGKVDPKHVAWILGCLYNLACFYKYNDITHCGITLDNCFVSPSMHSTMMIGGFWYSKKIKEKLIGVPSDVYSVMPNSVKKSKESQAIIDLESIRLIGRTLLGDKNGILLVNDSNIPNPLRNWVRGMSGTCTFKEYEKWTKCILDSFGQRKFIEMNIDEKKLLNKIEGRN